MSRSFASVYAVVDFRADLIGPQSACIRKFMDAPLTVLSNAPDSRKPVRASIRKACDACGARYVDVLSQNHKTGNVAHAHALDWAWANVVPMDPCEIAVVMDFDVFPVKTVDVEAMMDGWDMAGNKHVRSDMVEYPWPGLLFLRVATLPDVRSISFFGDMIGSQPVDVGGRICNYLRTHRGVRVRWLGKEPLRQDLLPAGSPECPPGLGMTVLEGGFVHYEGASNWSGRPEGFVRRKDEYVHDLLSFALTFPSKP